MQIIVSLPWPNPKLNPNRSGGRGWRATYSAKASAKRYAYFATIEQIPAAIRGRGFPGPVIVSYRFNPPNLIARDIDNLIASMKSYFDGIKEAIKVDDSEWEWLHPTSLSEVVKGGEVVVKITGGDDAERILRDLQILQA